MTNETYEDNLTFHCEAILCFAFLEGLINLSKSFLFQILAPHFTYFSGSIYIFFYILTNEPPNY